MTEPINIRLFNKGTITSPDAEDISLESSSDALNVEPDANDGKLKAIPTNGDAYTANSVQIPDVRLGEFIENNGVFDLIYHDSSDNHITSVTNFYGAEASRTLADLVTANVSDNSVIVPNNREVHIGAGNGSANVPKWVGRIDYGQFGGSAPSGLQIENAECANGGSTAYVVYTSITKNEHATVTTDVFQAGDVYCYDVSIVYDTYQESLLPIPSGTVFTTASGFSITTGNSSEKIDLQLKIVGFASISKRISAIKLYRAKAKAITAIPTVYTPIEAFRLVETISIVTGWTTSGTDKVYEYDDIGKTGNTYEEETGMPETLDNTIVNYSLACKGNGFLFVGKCYHPDIEEASQCIFRSKEKRFDMFDWSTDILRLPRIPTAMVFFLGKLYAFDTNNLYVINPDNLLIEEIYPGAGAIGQRSVTVTPFGMFFANEINAFMFDGREVIPIGNRIKISSSSGRSWQTFAFGVLTDIIVLYDSYKGIVLFINDYSSKTFAWAYHISKDRWDAMDLGQITIDANSGAFLGKDGEVYLSNATQTVRLFGGVSRQNFEFVSQEITMDDPSQDKMFYNVIVDSSGAGSITTTYGIEGATPTTALTGTQIGVSQTYAKTLKIKLVSSGIVDVDSIAILARRLRGSRVY